MGDRETYTEVTSQSWFSRLGESIKSVGVGLIIFIAAFPVLWKNEGCAVKIAQGLTEGAGAVISLPAPKVDTANNGKLVHFTGDATTSDILSDPTMGISENAIRLVRTVQMYQWKEVTSSKTEKKLGGGTETRTEYRYEKGWSESVINSNNFKVQAGHTNPAAMEIQSEKFKAQNVTVGDFTLPDGLVSQISNEETLTVTPDRIPPQYQGRAQVSGNEIYIGYNPATPQIGDLKVSYKIVKSPQKVSIVAQQQGNTLTQYMTKAKTTIMMLSMGTVPADQMFQQAQESNVTRTWLVRLLGFVLMFIGISMIFKPIATFGDVVPIVGSILNFGIGVFAFIVSLALSLIVIAIAWIAARPILGIALLVIGVGGFVAFKVLGKKKQAQAAS
jgi:uncharacterized membrane protein YecN with MAPEG domain